MNLKLLILCPNFHFFLLVHQKSFFHTILKKDKYSRKKIAIYIFFNFKILKC